MDADAPLGPFGKVVHQFDLEHQDGVRKAGVMLIIYPTGDSLSAIFIQRPQYDGVHGGQMALPGGKLEAGEGFLEAAKREVEEEIGLGSEHYQVLGQMLPIYIPPSKFYVLPFVAFADVLPPLTKEDYEVEEIVSVPIDLFNNYDAVQETEVKARGAKFRVPAFLYNDRVIWGATARIMAEFVQLQAQITTD